MKNYKHFITIVVLIGWCLISDAQSILIDKGINAEGLWCFPVHKKENTYRYLPQRARLSLQNDSIPEFSFLRYITEKPSENKSISANQPVKMVQRKKSSSSEESSVKSLSN